MANLLMILSWGLFYSLHTALASGKLKRFLEAKWPKEMKWYRLFYTLLSSVFFLGILIQALFLPNQLLIKANSAKQNVEIAEINRVLGIKDKNVGLQKKVRSDVINAINDKYIFITQSENNLIASVRKEDDKRFYEYFVVPTEVKAAQKLIEKN